MPVIGYHASHEQFPPEQLLQCVRAAEQAGFDAAMSSDHFHPWGTRDQGESGFAWTWLGAAMHATRLPFGVVTSPVGFRYHPAIVAQAAATLGRLYPGRFWMALGTGEALNEHIVGQRWPTKPELRARLETAVEMMRALFRGETVTRFGAIPIDRAKLFSRPREPPAMVGAALSTETAAWAASWADGLITINMPGERTRDIIDAYRRAGGRGPVRVQVHLAWAQDEDEALRNAHEQWGTNVFDGALMGNVATPEEFEAMRRFVRPEDVRGHVVVSSDLDAHVRRCREFLAWGADELFLHEVGPDQTRFIETFGKQVVPALREGPR